MNNNPPDNGATRDTRDTPLCDACYEALPFADGSEVDP